MNPDGKGCAVCNPCSVLAACLLIKDLKRTLEKFLSVFGGHLMSVNIHAWQDKILCLQFQSAWDLRIWALGELVALRGFQYILFLGRRQDIQILFPMEDQDHLKLWLNNLLEANQFTVHTTNALYVKVKEPLESSILTYVLRQFSKTFHMLMSTRQELCQIQ